MNPASAMSFALRKPGRSVLACARTGTDFAVDAVIAAKAAERRRSRFVNIFDIPSRFAACVQAWAGTKKLRSLRAYVYAKSSNPNLSGCPLLARNGHAILVAACLVSGAK